MSFQFRIIAVAFLLTPLFPNSLNAQLYSSLEQTLPESNYPELDNSNIVIALYAEDLNASDLWIKRRIWHYRNLGYTKEEYREIIIAEINDFENTTLILAIESDGTFIWAENSASSSDIIYMEEDLLDSTEVQLLVNGIFETEIATLGQPPEYLYSSPHIAYYVKSTQTDQYHKISNFVDLELPSYLSLDYTRSEIEQINLADYRVESHLSNEGPEQLRVGENEWIQIMQYITDPLPGSE